MYALVIDKEIVRVFANPEGFTLDDNWLWGATALIVNELATVYRTAYERLLKNGI